MVGSCGSGTSAPSDLQDIKPGQVNIGWCACNVHLKKNSPNFRSSFRCRLRINGTTTMSLFSSEAVLVTTFEFDPQPWFLLSRLQLPHNALSPYSPCVQDLSHSRGELLQLRCSWTTNYTVPKWVPFWGLGSPWGPFWGFGSPLGPLFMFWVPFFSILD